MVLQQAFYFHVFECNLGVGKCLRMKGAAPGWEMGLTTRKLIGNLNSPRRHGDTEKMGEDQGNSH